jgi:hypothetical protein
MPVLDLREPKDRSKLKPHSHFELLAVMLSPGTDAGSQALRERIMDSVRREAGPHRARRGRLAAEKAKHHQAHGAARGGEAGYLYASLVQLAHQNIAPSLDAAIAVLLRLLPPIMGGGQRAQQDRASNEEVLVRSPRLLRDLFREFGPVAHLWAAFLFDEQAAQDATRRYQLAANGKKSMPKEDFLDRFYERYGIAPVSLAKLPKFLAYADAIQAKYLNIRFKDGAKNPAVIRHPWKVLIPDDLRVAVKIRVVPIPPELLPRTTRCKSKTA